MALAATVRLESVRSHLGDVVRETNRLDRQLVFTTDECDISDYQRLRETMDTLQTALDSLSVRCRKLVNDRIELTSNSVWR